MESVPIHSVNGSWQCFHECVTLAASSRKGDIGVPRDQSCPLHLWGFFPSLTIPSSHIPLSFTYSALKRTQPDLSHLYALFTNLSMFYTSDSQSAVPRLVALPRNLLEKQILSQPRPTESEAPSVGPEICVLTSLLGYSNEC